VGGRETCPRRVVPSVTSAKGDAYGFELGYIIWLCRISYAGAGGEGLLSGNVERGFVLGPSGWLGTGLGRLASAGICPRQSTNVPTAYSFGVVLSTLVENLCR